MDLGTFLHTFQKTVNEGLTFLKEEITDPEHGLEIRVENLEKNINTADSGLKAKVDKLQLVVTDADVLFAKRLGKKSHTIEVEFESREGNLSTRKVVCPRHMLIKCSTRFHIEVMSKKKNLGGLVDPKGFTYFVA